MPEYGKLIEEIGQAVTENTPVGYKVNLAVYTKMREVVDYFVWLMESPDHKDIRLSIKQSMDPECGYLKVNAEHLNMWCEIFHTRFCEAMAKADVYEIYSVNSRLMIDISFHDLYIPA